MNGQNMCAHCGTQGSESKPLRTCSGCGAVKYCSKACQRKKGPFHKTICEVPAAQADGGDGAADDDGAAVVIADAEGD